jgi:hypothetical protein
MSNTTLQADVVAKAALAILENELGWVGDLYRAPEEEFSNSVNGYKVGDTIRIRRPADFTVRSGATMDLQDVIEGRTTLTVDQQIGVDFSFTSSDLTLKIEDLSERVMKPAMSAIVNYMAKDVATVMYQGAYNWVGTAGTAINSFADFALGPQRLDEMAVPQDGRLGILSPSDWWGFVSGQAGVYVQDIARDAIRTGKLGNIGGIDLYKSQVTPTHTTGSRTNSTPLTEGTSQNVTYDTVKNTWTQSLITDGWTSSLTLTKGDVFTIDGVYMVNPKTKVSTGIKQQFVVKAAKTADETASNPTTLTISPPIILTGPHQTVTFVGVSSTDELTITNIGTASTNYVQNMVFHKNCMALACVPMEMPQASVNGARKSYKGISVRVLPVYDGINDVSKWRLDLLYGRELLDPRMITRISGT